MSKSTELAKEIINHLGEKGGFDNWWDNIDSCIQDEIINDIAFEIEKAIKDE